jgi:hypothetical protein
MIGDGDRDFVVAVDLPWWVTLRGLAEFRSTAAAEAGAGDSGQPFEAEAATDAVGDTERDVAEGGEGVWTRLSLARVEIVRGVVDTAASGVNCGVACGVVAEAEAEAEVAVGERRPLARVSTVTGVWGSGGGW